MAADFKKHFLQARGSLRGEEAVSMLAELDVGPVWVGLAAEVFMNTVN